jgi:hypothetical protein
MSLTLESLTQGLAIAPREPSSVIGTAVGAGSWFGVQLHRGGTRLPAVWQNNLTITRR